MNQRIDAWLQCISCRSIYPLDYRGYACEKCGDLLDVVLDLDKVEVRSWSIFRDRSRGVWRYRELIPVDFSKRVTLREGGTPLIDCKRLNEWVGVKELYLKFEGANPTGSFKDRGMTVAVTKALELNVRGVICASTGNTAASLAAYASRAGLPCITIIPEGAALGKIFQAIAYGAILIKIKGSFDQALKIVISVVGELGLYLLNSINTWRLEGQKTLGYELAEEVDGEYLVSVPVGNCGNIAAIWKGFSELKYLGLIDEAPRMFGVQAEGASPFAKMVEECREKIEPVENPQTIASAIRIGRPVNWKKALRAVRESRGGVEVVSDGEILEAQRAIARLEGLGVEPASAASVAGVKKMVAEGRIDRGEKVVCICTGHLLKDPNPDLFKPFTILETEPDLQKIIKELTEITSIIKIQ
ncbi:MAG: threonine synthase [Aigarchaeota archaeon]|nr:threonine synthase [Aigarchaeota archaeon]MDW7986853.1 threonine synthase [Nitrososphaerota archaeon]